MSQARIKHYTQTRVDVGSLRQPIKIEFRKLVAPTGSGTTANSTNVNIIDTWASIETVTNVSIFDETNTEQVVTHYFNARFLEGINTGDAIIYNGERYKILAIENFEGRSLFIRFKCALRGPKDIGVNKA